MRTGESTSAKKWSGAVNITEKKGKGQTPTTRKESDLRGKVHKKRENEMAP